MIRVLLADDEAMIRSALAALLRLEDDIDVIAECADGEEAVAEATSLRPDVCLLDLEMPGQIARTLSLAPGTVRNHVSAILTKLAVATRQQAVLLAEERGWI
ncbi:MAG: response regulator transcription factor [Leucobacter sp.]